MNRNNLENIDAVQEFLDTNLLLEGALIEEVKIFTEEQGIECNFDRLGENFSDFSGSMRCYTPVTNPAFYGVTMFPENLGESAWRSIAKVPEVVIDFVFLHGSLRDIGTAFSIRHL